MPTHNQPTQSTVKTTTFFSTRFKEEHNQVASLDTTLVEYSQLCRVRETNKENLNHGENYEHQITTMVLEDWLNKPFTLDFSTFDQGSFELTNLDPELYVADPAVKVLRGQPTNYTVLVHLNEAAAVQTTEIVSVVVCAPENQFALFSHHVPERLEMEECREELYNDLYEKSLNVVCSNPSSSSLYSFYL